MNLRTNSFYAKQEPKAERARAAQKLYLGRVYIAANLANSVLSEDILAALVKHASGNWDELPSEEAAVNLMALRRGEPVCSLQRCRNGRTLWIATEPDRGVTTVILAETS